MSDEEPKVVIRLTEADIPNWDGDAGEDDDPFYCCLWKKDSWGGWYHISGGENSSTEGECAQAARYYEADSYTWTHKRCP